LNLILSHLTTVCVQCFCDSVGKVLVGSVRSAQSGLAPHHFDPFFEKRITSILKCLFAPQQFFFSSREFVEHVFFSSRALFSFLGC